MKRRQFGNNRVNIWPGFVDALATLIMAIIFVLMIFVVAQVYLSKSLTTKDQALTKLNGQLQELDQLLATERDHAQTLLDDLTESEAENKKKQQLLEGAIIKLGDAETQITETAAALLQLQGRYADLEKKYVTQSNLSLDLQQKLDQSENNLLGLTQDLSNSRDQEAKTQLILKQLQVKLAELTENLAKLQKKRESLTAELKNSTDQNAALNKRLEKMVADLQESLAIKESLEKDHSGLKLRFSALQADQQTVQTENQNLKTENQNLIGKYDALKQSETTLQQQAAQLNQNLSAAEKSALSANQQISDQAQLILELQNAVAGLKADITRLNGLLETSEAESEAKQVEILNLGKRLNAALAAKVESLSRYQSRFMAKLRDILGARPDVRIIDDRFIFQSEVLFASGSAEIATAGQQQLGQFAETLLSIANQIPAGTDWVLRVDGHTDKRPINTFQFPDNWALSTARARAVVAYLIDQGVPPQHLAATGFGEYRPLDKSDDEIAYRRNRRIEFRLTSQ